MFSALIRLLDQQRAFEIADFAVAFILLLLLIFLILMILSLIQSRKLKRELARRSEEVYYHLLPTFRLDAEEHELVKRLAAFLNFPQQKYRILINPQLFDACADRLRAKEDLDEGLLADLRSKLGFSSTASGLLPISSVELPREMPMLIVRKGQGKIRGKVAANTKGSLVIGTDQNSEAVQPDTPCMVYFQSPAGFFSFPSRIIRQDKRSLRLQHSGQIKRHQRRRYSRKRVRLPVFLRIVNGNSESFSCDLVDLSGGGATLRNPEKRLKEGDRAELSFAPKDQRFHLLARVVRTSKGGDLAHVEFTSPDQAIRNLITHSLLSD